MRAPRWCWAGGERAGLCRARSHAVYGLVGRTRPSFPATARTMRNRCYKRPAQMPDAQVSRRASTPASSQLSRALERTLAQLLPRRGDHPVDA